jgi:hypothetical protein
LFERYVTGSSLPRRYYACSACRDRKECNFFQWADEDIPDSHQRIRNRCKRDTLLPYSHKEYFRQYDQTFGSIFLVIDLMHDEVFIVND